MPPALSDEEISQSSGDEEIPAKEVKKSKPAPVEEEEEESNEEEEYVVEGIVAHKTVKGKVLYHVKWQGYDDPADMTWEGEDNLEGVEALDEYHTLIGGRPVPGKKRKGRKSGVETESSTPVAAKRMKKEKEWAPPPGSWEDEVDHVDTVEQRVNPKTGENEKFGYLVWSNQIKTQHPLPLIFKKCPQRMLTYFEQHLVFNQADTEETNGNASMTGIDDDDL
ncbi:uncharacterized protein CC84DRAFT_1222471 [Paraphaeosphaeria sporulosa]|uniref:Chromo domain-containing protein n=1 Tax=Paraphaeosphaeria sporulosa TaxID=1460663 RepID=A0A177C0M1_9PLEO|nr:uncharacterized protein CC84DRAFT_1222471 [Paraphaeosphaeria sporulosa]OAG00160.1 hypothetical protein CC84DRAFT_1222471 [Paraphaeosphaeria sporulosa]